MARGSLRIYLGATPGVGKTYAMLDEGHRRLDRGTDVVVAYVESHGRPNTAAKVGGLEIIPRRSVQYRGAVFDEMDVDAVLKRHPKVALVDELAHTNAPGSRNGKRWQDVEELLDAGIDVISTVNVQHLEGLNDVVQQITGIVQQETVPDVVVRRAEQIELVDMTPEALRRRMAHGNIYPPEKVDAALANFFRPGNLAALRELALLWLADRVEEGLQRYLDAHSIADAWETRERLVVAVSGAEGGDRVIRRASRIATRTRAELVAVRVTAGDGLTTRADSSHLEEQRQLVQELGGVFREVVSDNVAEGLVAFARAERATQLVLGASRYKKWIGWAQPSVVRDVVRSATDLDVHVISLGDQSDGIAPPGAFRSPARRHLLEAVPRQRLQVAVLMAIVGLPAITALLSSSRHHLTLPTDLLVLLLFTVVVAAVGGVLVGLATAIAASLLANWFFVPPLHTLTIGVAENLVALAVFILVSIIVSALVDREATRTRQAIKAQAGTEALMYATSAILVSDDPVPELVDRLRSTFGFDTVVLGRRIDGAWVSEYSSGTGSDLSPDSDDSWPLGSDSDALIVTRGGAHVALDQTVLRSFLDQVSLAMNRRSLQREAAAAERLADANALRTALLQAVSHDLRTPLASIKASVTSLLQDDIAWSLAEKGEFLDTINEEADRLNRVVGNLLDMSRLQAGALNVEHRPTYLDDVVAAAISNLGGDAGRVTNAVPADLPPVNVDGALLERALANLISNAVAWSPAGEQVVVSAGVVGPRIHLRVIDRGPGIPEADHDRVFAPFQRIGDRSSQAGVGLGLAIARGFIEACGGEITLDETPGGGLTMDIAFSGAL